MAKAASFIPAGMHTVTPVLALDGAAEAIELFTRALGAVELPGRAPDPSGKKIWHAEIRVGSSVIFVNDVFPEMGSGASPASLWLYVEDVDAAFQRAVAAGMKAEMPPMDMFWGDRFAKVSDRFGNGWSLCTHVEDLTPEEMKAKEAAFIAAMKR